MNHSPREAIQQVKCSLIFLIHFKCFREKLLNKSDVRIFVSVNGGQSRQWKAAFKLEGL